MPNKLFLSFEGLFVIRLQYCIIKHTCNRYKHNKERKKEYIDHRCLCMRVTYIRSKILCAALRNHVAGGYPPISRQTRVKTKQWRHQLGGTGWRMTFRWVLDFSLLWNTTKLNSWVEFSCMAQRTDYLLSYSNKQLLRGIPMSDEKVLHYGAIFVRPHCTGTCPNVWTGTCPFV